MTKLRPRSGSAWASERHVTAAHGQVSGTAQQRMGKLAAHGSSAAAVGRGGRLHPCPEAAAPGPMSSSAGCRAAAGAGSHAGECCSNLPTASSTGWPAMEQHTTGLGAAAACFKRLLGSSICNKRLPMPALLLEISGRWRLLGSAAPVGCFCSCIGGGRCGCARQLPCGGSVSCFALQYSAARQTLGLCCRPLLPASLRIAGSQAKACYSKVAPADKAAIKQGALNLGLGRGFTRSNM